MKSWLILVIITAIFIFQCTSVSGQMHLTGNAKLRIDSSTIIKSNGSLILSQESALELQGTMILKKDIENRRSIPNSLGTGTIVLSGKSNQTVAGNNIIQNLTVDNDSGITIDGITTVNGTLSLKKGLIDLGNGHLHIGISASVSGNPSGMGAMPGSGAVRTEFPGASNHPSLFFLHSGSDSVEHRISDDGLSSFGIFGDTQKNGLTVGAGSHPPFVPEHMGPNRLLMGIGNSKVKESIIESPMYAIFPNPTHGFFTLETGYGLPDECAHVKIFNTLGELIQKHDLGPQSSYRFSLIGSPPGVYLVQVTVGRMIMIEKIVKN